MRMNLIERKLLRRNAVLGVVLTASMVAAEFAGLTQPLERWAYDRRLELCNRTAPRPTETLVHLDIDDSSLDLIGEWPWPREVWASVFDELGHAGAKSAAIDVLFTGGQRQATSTTSVANATPATQSAPAESGGDAEFAGSIERFGNVVLSASFEFASPAMPGEHPLEAALTAELLRDPEQGFDEVRRRLAAPATGPRVAGAELAPLTNDDYARGLRRALGLRIARDWPEGAAPIEQLYAAVLPVYGRNSPAGRVLKREYDAFKASRALRHFTIAKPAGFQEVLSARSETLPMPELSMAASQCAFIDYLPDTDGVVRVVPLWAESRGRLVPHLGLALACAHLGVDLADVRFTDSQVILPRPGSHGDVIAIPVQTAASRSFGKVGMFMRVPYFGTEQWLSMYDTSGMGRPAQHLPVGPLWSLASARARARHNLTLTDEALMFVMSRFAQESAERYAAQPPPPDDAAARSAEARALFGDDFVRQTAELYASMSAVDREKLAGDEQQLAAALDALRRLPQVNERIAREIAEQQDELTRLLQGKAVLVGWTATGKTDFVRTSIHPACPGVVVHGTVFNAIMTGFFKRDVPPAVTLLVIALMGLLCTVIVSRLSPTPAVILTLAVAGVYVILNGAVLFDQYGLVVGVAGPVATAGVVWVSLTVNRFVTERRERSRITRRFSSYVDPVLVNYVIEHPEIETFAGEVREMTVVFTDLAGFTTLTEKLRERSVQILSDYLARMVPLVEANGGLVNKFLGDGLMFFYGAPVRSDTHAADAVRTVLQMREALEAFNDELRAAGNPTVAMRAGISTGPMVVGDAGPARRSDYTVLGDTVNLAARLESANKYMGTATLVSSQTVEATGEAGEFLFRKVAPLRVVGKSEVVWVYEPLCRRVKGDADAAAQGELAEMTGALAEAFAAGRFDECVRRAGEMRDARAGPAELLDLYENLCRQRLTSPPQGLPFDGAITLESK